MDSKRLAFIAKWADPVSGVQWTFNLSVFPESLEVELVDLKNRKAFLRRSFCEGLKLTTLHVGGKTTIFGRQLDIVDYGDEGTRRLLESKQQQTIALVLPDATKSVGEIIKLATLNGFTVSKIETFRFTHSEARDFLCLGNEEACSMDAINHLASKNSFAFQLVGADAVNAWTELLGPADPIDAKANFPGSIRARFGTDAVRHACHGSANQDVAAKEYDFLFGSSTPTVCPRQPESTLGIIKPHAIADGHMGAILTAILERFDVLSIHLLHFSKVHAAEFFEVYRGVVPASDAVDMADELSSGPCVALQVKQRCALLSNQASVAAPGSSVESFRQLCGPSDPAIGKLLRPSSLRARFGSTQKCNAMHCTDLVEDAELELAYCFEFVKCPG